MTVCSLSASSPFLPCWHRSGRHDVLRCGRGRSRDDSTEQHKGGRSHQGHIHPVSGLDELQVPVEHRIAQADHMRWGRPVMICLVPFLSAPRPVPVTDLEKHQGWAAYLHVVVSHSDT